MACLCPAPLQGASCFFFPFPGGCARKAALPPANIQGSSGADFLLSYSYQLGGYPKIEQDKQSLRSNRRGLAKRLNVHCQAFSNCHFQGRNLWDAVLAS